MMLTTILKEEGYELALRGLAYSFRDQADPLDDWWTPEKFRKMKKVGAALCPRGSEERKWIRQIVLWLDIVAPRYWWSEFDTYKIGTVAQSESTMHKLAKRRPCAEDFAASTPAIVIEQFAVQWGIHKGNVQVLKACLPEGYLQRRLVTLNYEVLGNIIHQRKAHRLPEWRVFIDALLAQLEHPELLTYATGERNENC